METLPGLGESDLSSFLRLLCVQKLELRSSLAQEHRTPSLAAVRGRVGRTTCPPSLELQPLSLRFVKVLQALLFQHVQDQCSSLLLLPLSVNVMTISPMHSFSKPVTPFFSAFHPVDYKPCQFTPASLFHPHPDTHGQISCLVPQYS